MGMICEIHSLNEDTLDILINDENDDVEDFFETSENSIDIDKSWHAIHFIFVFKHSFMTE